LKKEKNIKTTSIGGQAVMEGVMMRGESVIATAVRDADGIIRIESKRFKPAKQKSKILRLPIIRGIVNFINSMVVGVSTLMRSADVYGEGEPSKFEMWLAQKLKINLMSVITFFSMLIGIGLSIFLFIFLPHLATTQMINNGIAFNFIEGGLRILIFIIYLLLVSLLKDIKRVFMYHGAEHKTISCYEKGLPLTVENARGCSRLHNRCGTTFMFFVMIVSILVYSVANITTATFFEKFLIKIALLPIVAGLSYELLKALAKTDSPLVFPLKAPGLLLQKITTSEPDDEMLEVAITAFNTVIDMQENKDLSESKFIVSKKLSKLLEETQKKLESGGIKEKCEAEWIVSIALKMKRDELKTEKIVNPKDIEKINGIVNERLTGRPLWYVLGDTEFYGYKIKVDERVLIPRPETELLVEKVLNNITDSDTVLDLCTGSGAIAIAIAKNKKAIVTASDVSAKALELAKENAQINGVDINFIESDLFDKVKGKFSVIVSNPPYIKNSDITTLEKEVKDFEPSLALKGGEDGLDYYRIIAKYAPKHLFAGGVLYLECGEGQAKDIVKLLDKFTGTEVFKDYNDIDRIIKATL
jgi:release factor-specific protein-(glutamine-N5) methyltransferase